MTPQLMQSIKLLQLSNIELTAFVEAELEKNPLIERVESDLPSMVERRTDIDGGQESETQKEASSSALQEGDQGEWMQDSLETSADSISEKLDTSLENVFPDDHEHQSGLSSKRDRAQTGGMQSPLSGYATASGEDYNLEAFVASETTLRDHLAGQLAMSAVPSITTMIAHDLLDHVDESGYMRGHLDRIAKRLGVDITLVEEALKLLQTFEPTGICATSLPECLKIQLREKDRLDPAMNALVDNLDLLAKRDFAVLGEICGVSREDLVDMLREIQALDPRPGTVFESAPVRPIVPDILVTKANDGSWNVELNTSTLPRILVNQSYFAKVFRTTRDSHEIEFLNECLQTANWLHKSLDQRAQTILKVASEIIRQQDEFLLYGVESLKPLNLRTVADAIGMHESTVSRVTSNKYMMTARGVFELKYFFTTAIQSTANEDAHSSESVRHRIRKLIDDESPKKVLSDDKIVAALRDDGVEIARRTVAKYREAMYIQSSVQRRREKKALASIK